MHSLLRFLAALLLLMGCSGSAEAPATHPAPIAAPAAVSEPRIPPEARLVLAHVRERRAAPPGHVGGRRFGNFEQRLPKTDDRGAPIAYQEWDIFPKVPGHNRGAHRLVTGSDGRAWYTADHYGSFMEIKEPR